MYRTLRWLRLPHPAVRPGEHFFGHPLDDRDELQVLRAELFGQEAVDLQRVVGVGGVHRGQRVPFDAGFSQTVQSGDHPVERGLSALVAAVRVVHLAGTVDRDPDQEVVVGQEARPGVIDQGRVGLDRVQDGLTRPTVLALQLQAAGEEVDTHQRGLTALEREGDLLLIGMSGQELFDVARQDLVVHAERRAGYNCSLDKKKQ